MAENKNYYIALISVHGLIRGDNLELGRDADTGGQTKYVVELATALGEHPDVARVDLITRRIDDPSIDQDYRQPEEPLGDKVKIIRIGDGVDDYLPKEQLWSSLDIFTDNVLDYLRGQPKAPDVIHTHYADAGFVGSRLTSQMGIPQVHTGHSLGRVKRRRLLASGLKSAEVDARYAMARRIDAEEETLASARLVITSTHQEIEEQYGMYDFYQPDQMRVVPPGTDLSRFKPATGTERQSSIYREISRFLNEPEKPLILALSRPDQRKNIQSLIVAYGESQELQARANLLIVAGNRDEIRDMDEGAQEVLTDILMQIDNYDLYGKVAYPKHHQADEVPLFYQLAALLKGVFINPALTEPFGLTLIEAAACGAPLVATDDGGPKDIIGNCQNGYLVDPLNIDDIQQKLLKVLGSSDTWREFSANGIHGVNTHYSWQAHVEKYLATISPIIEHAEPAKHMTLSRRPMLYHDRALFTDLDQNLLGNPERLGPFIQTIQNNRKCVSFGIATGRRLDSALKMIKRHGLPKPDVLITSLGTEIYYAPRLTRDKAWSRHIDYLWKPNVVRDLVCNLPGIKRQPKTEQSYFKVSCYYDPEIAPGVEEITRLLHQHDISANVIHAFGQYLDIVPTRASKGFALRWYAEQFGIPVEHILAAGGSGADEDMMRGNTLAVVVANRHNEELSELTDIERIFFATQPHAAGIVEAIEHYDFFRSCKVPQA